jgi:protein transport protein SEC24
MLVVGDLDEVFTPIRTGLFVNPAESRTSVESLLQSLPTRFNGTVERSAALSSAVRAGLAAFAGRGGHLIVFQSTIPTIGPGALPPAPSEDSMYGTSEEMKLHMPRDKLWLDIAEECVDDGVGVTLFLTPSAYIDIGSVGALASVTGGEIFFHPRYDPARDAVVLDSQIQRVTTRYQGFNCALRVRASNGLRVTKYHGNFYRRSATDIEFGLLDADKSISIELEHTGTLDPRGNAHLQCAALYTSVDGQRRVRVINLALNVVELAGSVFQYADTETTVAHFAREGKHLEPRSVMVARAN